MFPTHLWAACSFKFLLKVGRVTAAGSTSPIRNKSSRFASSVHQSGTERGPLFLPHAQLLLLKQSPGQEGDIVGFGSIGDGNDEVRSRGFSPKFHRKRNVQRSHVRKGHVSIRSLCANPRRATRRRGGEKGPQTLHLFAYLLTNRGAGRGRSGSQGNFQIFLRCCGVPFPERDPA
jgi:hypothetical protein